MFSDGPDNQSIKAMTFAETVNTIVPGAAPMSVLWLLKQGRVQEALIKADSVSAAVLLADQDEYGRNALQVAVEKGPLHRAYTEVAEVLIKTLRLVMTAEGPALDHQDFHGFSAFFIAVQTGNANVIEALAEAGATITALTTARSNVFHLVLSAKAPNKIALLKRLIELFHDRACDLRSHLNAANSLRQQPVHLALGSSAPQDKAAVELLLANGASAEAQSDHMPPLHVISGNNRVDLAALFIAYVPEGRRTEWINRQYEFSISRQSALGSAVANHHKEMVEWLIDNGADPGAGERMDNLESTIIGNELQYGEQDDESLAILQLLSAGISDLNAQQDDQPILLDFTLTGNHFLSAMLLIINGADPALLLEAEWLPDILREKPACSDIINMCKAVSKSQIPKGPDKMRAAIWHWLAAQGKLEWLDGLIKLEKLVAASRRKSALQNGGMDEFRNGFELIDADGNTPLHGAIAKGNVNVALKFLALGANLEVKNHEGKIPLTMTSDRAVLSELSEYFEQVAKVMKKHGIALSNTKDSLQKPKKPKKPKTHREEAPAHATPEMTVESVPSTPAAAGAGGLQTSAEDSDSEEDISVLIAAGATRARAKMSAASAKRPGGREAAGDKGRPTPQCLNHSVTRSPCQKPLSHGLPASPVAASPILRRAEAPVSCEAERLSSAASNSGAHIALQQRPDMTESSSAVTGIELWPAREAVDSGIGFAFIFREIDLTLPVTILACVDYLGLGK